MRTRVLSLSITITVSMFLGVLFFGCDQVQQQGGSTRTIEQNSASEKTFQDVMTRMENYSSIIKKNEDIYNLAMENSGSVLSKRQANDAAKEIVSKSHELLDLANNALNNDVMISKVSGAKNKITEYKQFAQQKIKQYE